ncbi:MAG: hypothetical protein MI746_12390 [Pseudomonadales bacterium]|nr:hypothetical protein [Pseudomonadales bacterium]
MSDSATNSDSQFRMNTYSNEQLQQAVTIYAASFEDSIPLELLAGAANRFRSRELMSALLDRVKTNDPVQNWDEFSNWFLNE